MTDEPRAPLWYKDAIIYELHVKTFFDSNGDGIGDFQGLIQKLDYIQRLGVTCLWLLPFYESPLRDDGYDIAHYERVHPQYGTLADFRHFLDEAHARGLKVITELVINHTSDQHPWFQAARRAPAGSAKRNYYVWSDTDRAYAAARIVYDREVIVVVANLSASPQMVALSVPDWLAGAHVTEVVDGVSLPPVAREPYTLLLDPHAYRWLELTPAKVQVVDDSLSR
jgi:glycosidase